MNPYQELGVPKDADAPAVKRAYRRRARETHPDAGGNKEEFQRASAAYKLLADPARRARYDATGEVDGGVDNEAARLLSIFANLVLGVVNTVDVRHQDVMAEVRSRIAADVTTVKKAKADLAKRIKNYEQAARRTRRKVKGENAVSAFIEIEAAKQKDVLAKHDANLEMLKRLDAMASDYDYDFDIPETRFVVNFST